MLDGNLHAAALTTMDSAWRQRRVLITGITGFIGGWLAWTLQEGGAEVVGLVRDNGRYSALNALSLTSRVNLVAGALEDYSTVERIVNEYDVDTVFHLAAQAIVGTANRSPVSTFESNIRGTWNVLEACRQSRLVQRVVIASSDKAYGDQATLPYQEASPLNGLYPYDASKVCADVLARCYAHSFGLPVAVTRCANVYGGGDFNWSRLIPGTIRSAIRNENPVIRSDGTPERDYIFVSDAVRAYLAVGARANEDGVRGEAFNFGSGCPHSALTVVTEVLRACGRTGLEPQILGAARSEIDRQYLDSTKAAEVLGWFSEVGLADGLDVAWEWYVERAAAFNIL